MAVPPSSAQQQGQARQQPKGWVYHQSTGELTRDGQHVAGGYSGIDAGRNNPAMETSRDTGPIPQGTYTMGRQFHSTVTGPGAMRLTPNPGTQTYGRTDLEIHGDSRSHPGQASHGCIILPRDARDRLNASPDNTLRVVP